MEALHYLLGNERTFQINVNSINQDVFSQQAADNALFFLLFLFFPPYQQLKRVFKNVLYLAESIIRTFDFEKMNGLIDEPFNLEGECNKQWNVKIGLYKDTVNNNAIYHASPSVWQMCKLEFLPCVITCLLYTCVKENFFSATLRLLLLSLWDDWYITERKKSEKIRIRIIFHVDWNIMLKLT